MDRFNNQGATWADYLGDTLRGNVPVNQLIPRHPYLLDTLQLEEIFHKNTEHIMLLTADEAFAVVDELYNKSTSYAGNIKDATSGTKNISKLVSYKDAGKLVLNLKGQGIKAIPYVHKGVTYIKITGYPAVRRILNGTRYSVNNPRILEMGIGKAGINAGILNGARFCIYFSAAQRVAEFIFSSEHDVATFIGNITMDVAKVIVTIFVTKVALTTATWAATAVGFSAIVPISIGIFVIVSLGIVITTALIYLDEKYHLSDRLIRCIKEGVQAYQNIMDQNLQYGHSYYFSAMGGYY